MIFPELFLVLCHTGLQICSLSIQKVPISKFAPANLTKKKYIQINPLSIILNLLVEFDLNESEGAPALVRVITVTAEDLSLMCLSSLQALPYVALLIVMLFFIYAVIGMQVSCLLHPLFPSLCFAVLSLSSLIASLHSVRPPGVLSCCVPVWSLFFLPFSHCCYPVVVCLCLSASSPCLYFCLFHKLLHGLFQWWWVGDTLIWLAGDGWPLNSDWLPLVNADVMCCVLWLLPSSYRCLVR